MLNILVVYAIAILLGTFFAYSGWFHYGTPEFATIVSVVWTLSNIILIINYLDGSSKY